MSRKNRQAPSYSNDWDDPLDPIALTLKDIAEGKRPVLVVVHYEAPGGWQFLDGSDVSDQEPHVVAKEDLLKVHPDLTQVTDLPLGWKAERESVKGKWKRSKVADDA